MVSVGTRTASHISVGDVRGASICIVAVVLCIGFDLLPLIISSSYILYLPFAVLSLLIYLLSRHDKRVLGYWIICVTCNPSNAQASIPYNVLAALCVTLFLWKEIRHQIWSLDHRWRSALLVLFVGGFLLSIANWDFSDTGVFQQLKYLVDYVAILFLLPLALRVSFPIKKDYVNALVLLLSASTSILAAFYFLGIPGETSDDGIMVFFYSIANAQANFVRTQVSIVLVVLASASLALFLFARSLHLSLFGLLLFLVNVYIVLSLASTGSVAALAVASVVLVLMRIAKFGIMSSIRILLLVVGMGIALTGWGIIKSDSYFMQRVEYKSNNENDRLPKWLLGCRQILIVPSGIGWSLTTRASDIGVADFPHNDYLVYAVSYGVLGGIGYLLFVLRSLCISVWGLRIWQRDYHVDDLVIAAIGAAVLLCILVNSMTDHLVADQWYYQTAWTLGLLATTPLLPSVAAQRR